MSLTFNRFALFSRAQIGDPPILVLANGIDNVAWTDGLASGRSEYTLSTTAPDTSGMSAADHTGTGSVTVPLPTLRLGRSRTRRPRRQMAAGQHLQDPIETLYQCGIMSRHHDRGAVLALHL